MSYPDRYKLLRRERARRDLRSAVLYLVVALLALAVACWVSAMPVFGQTVEPLAASADAVCEIKTSDGGVGNGTLVDVTDGVGTIVTCSHNCPAGIQWIVCCFRGACYSARVDQVDRLNELAIVRCSAPVGVRPMPLEADGSIPQGQVCVAYRRNGQLFNAFGEARGPALQNVSPSNPDHAVISVYGANTPPGSSGGAVVNTAGKLVAVHFGNPGGVAQVSCGQPLKRILDWALPRRSGRIIPHATRPSVYVRPPQATQPAPQQPPPDPWQPSGNPSQGGGTYAGGEAGPQPSALGDQQEAKAPETGSPLSAVSSQPVFDTEWANQVDRNINTLDETTKANSSQLSAVSGQLEGLQKTFTGDMAKVARDIHGPEGAVAQAISARMKSVIEAVGVTAGELVDDRLAKAEQKINARFDEQAARFEETFTGKAIALTATVLGVQMPVKLFAASALMGPLGPIAAGLVYWRLKKRLGNNAQPASSGPGAGGAGNAPSFR